MPLDPHPHPPRYREGAAIRREPRVHHASVAQTHAEFSYFCAKCACVAALVCVISVLINLTLYIY